MGACQACEQPQQTDYMLKHDPTTMMMLDPDFYNDVTRAKAMEVGEFKYGDVELPYITKGPILMDDGSKYLGQFHNGKRCGRGKQVWEDFSIYEGYFDNDKANGRGRLIHSNGDVYEGEWMDDKAHGKGVYLHKDGSSYTGEWFEDMQHGYGI